MWKGLEIGHVLAHRYRVVECIGEGGMGRVYAAEDLKLAGKRWAVKEIIGQGEVWGAKEAELLLKLDHPQLPEIVDYFHFTDGNRTYLVMDLVKGRTITEWIKQFGPPSTEFVLHAGMQLCDILMYLHGLKPEPLIHRDLKPDNVMIDEHGTLHLIDFGISRTFKKQRLSDTVQLGTPAYLAPEQRLGRQSDVRTDLYHLGALLYYMLSGGKMADGAHDVTVNLAEVRLEIRQLIGRLLSELPEDRPSSAVEVKMELTQISAAVQSVTSPGPETSAPVDIVSQRVGFIVVASLYAGAGATRTALGLARALQQAGVPCAVVEYAKHPEYVYMMGGEQAVPSSYDYLLERQQPQRYSDSHSIEWTDGSITWYPMPPQANGANIAKEQWYSALLFIRSPVIIIDVGSHMDEEFVQDLMRRADHLVSVIDSRFHKWHRKDIEQRIATLAELRELRRSVHIVTHSYHTVNTSLWKAFPLPITVKVSSVHARQKPLDIYAPLLSKYGIMSKRKLPQLLRRRKKAQG